MIAEEQARAFAVMLLCGAGCALSHDALRLLGYLLGGREAFAALMDLALGIWLAAGMTIAGLYLGENPFRLYMFAGVLLGAMGWYAAFGRQARRFGRGIRKRFGKREKIIE